jgi:hypothetical protein
LLAAPIRGGRFRPIVREEADHMVKRPSITKPRSIAVTLATLVIGLSTWAGALPTYASVGWSIQASPNQTEYLEGVLDGVSCVSIASCTAVGHREGNVFNTLIERWDGTSWSMVSSPNQGAKDNYLSGVSCASASSCTAVGHYINSNFVDQTLVERWDGTTWSIVSSPNYPYDNNFLNSVSCVSAISCEAVGFHYNNNTGTLKSLIERWNGTSWSAASSPENGTYDQLSGVSCVSANSCTAVGTGSGNFGTTLIEDWNGTNWSVASSPNIGTGDYLLGVSCVSTSACTTVGNYTNASGVVQTLIERWDGTSWSVVSSPNTGTSYNYLHAVSCVSSSSCAAVGHYDNGGGVHQTLAESWNGTSWSVVSSPNNSSLDNWLSSVSCVSISSCTAAGHYMKNENLDQTLVESWNGTAWSVTASPSPSVVYRNSLYYVTCPSTTYCAAVGAYRHTGGPYDTLVESWNGAAWNLVGSPNHGTGDNFLNSISCVSASSCMAVGIYRGNSAYRTLAESWNGTAWSVIPSPNRGKTADNVLYGVSCVSSSSCTAVGYAGIQTLIEHWNGTSWSLVSSPNRKKNTNALFGVSCPSASSCEASGVYYSARVGAFRTLVERWNGTSWSTTSSPNQGKSTNYLNGISCVSANSCVAVGDYRKSKGVYDTLVESWNGSSWSTVASPNQVTGFNELFGVSCVATSTCTAVGTYRASGGVDRTLIEDWNGTAWSVVSSPNSGSKANILNGVSCATASFCKAAGTYKTSDYRTLIEAYG